MQNGLGEYMADAPTSDDVIANATPMMGTPDGLGAVKKETPVVKTVERVAPIVRDIRRISRGRATSGLGEDGMSTATAVTIVVGGMVLRGLAGYFAGRAMAPHAGKERAYAWTGVGLAVVFGAVGLGAQGLYAFQRGRQ